MALNGANAVPVENARVRLLLPPVEATPAYETRTDGFGLFGIKDMAPGAYRLVVEHPGYQRYETNLVAVAGGITNKMIRLTPIDGKIVFDVFFQAFCLQTHAALAGGKIVAEYWKPDGSITGAPDAVFNGALDQFGALSFPAMEDGFYTFRAEHTGWETLKYVPPANAGLILVGDKVRLSKSYYGSVFLRPIKQTLKVTAKGFDPVKNQPGPLKGVTIHITGIDLVNDNITLVPTTSAASGEDGSFKFGGLAPIRWRVEVARLGYKVATVIVKPNADGTLPDQVLDLELEPTKVRVRAASLYQKDEAVKGTVIQLKGIQGGNTEGIARQAVAAPDGTNFTASALFENLLPGRYWIHLKQETTISGLPSNSGVLRGPTSFRLSFFPKESYTQAVIAETSELKIDLEAVPAVIRGRLMATDQLGNLLTERSDPEPHRIWRKMSHDGITFLEHKLIKLLAETNNSVVVNTDEAGNFTALVPPGIFGVRIPTMTTHTGHNIEIGDLTDNVAAPRTSPWPYADIWPYPTFEGGHHGAGLAFDSRHEYQLNLFVHRNYINICGTIASPSAPFFDLVLRMDRDGGNALTYPYNHLYDVGAQVIAQGPQRYAGKVLPDNSYLIEDLKPGTYKLSVDNPLYTLPDKSFTIAPWDPPGIIPSTRPGAPGYYFPGITHIAGEFTLNPDWVAKGNIFIKRFNWVTGDFPGYQDQGSGPPSFFRMEGLPNRLFRYAFKNIPAPSYTIWRLYGSDWFTASGSGPMDFEAYTGGPRPNASPDKAPTEGGGYTLDLHAYSWKDRNFAISNIVVEFAGGGTRIANGFVPWDGRPQAVNATDPNQQWNYIGSEAKLVNPDTKVVQMNVFMIRNSLVKVNVTDTNGRPVPNAAVVLRNRFGNPVSQRVTGVEGTASFVAITPQVLYVDVSRRGYIPQRVMKTPSAEDPDITADIKLEEVPPPTIDLFTMNRFGIFLPGVSRSHDAEGLDPQNAAKRLTVTWKGEARGSNYNVTLDGFCQPDGKPGPKEISEVVDRVSEVWVIDRRAFTNAFVNSLNQGDALDNSAPRPLNYVNVSKWLESITTARKNGQPYYVIHQNKVRAERSGFNKFEGEFKVWELPSGVFQPIFLAITEGGGVAVMDYQVPDNAGLPGGKEYPLQGFNLPTWAANLLDVVGVAANLPEGETDLHNRFGDGFMKIGSFSPKAEARIGLDPITNTPEQNSYLTYKYVIGMDLPLGEPTTESGPLNMGPKFLGLKFTGANAEFEVIGKDRKAGLAVNFGAAPPDELERRDKEYHPVISEGAEEEPDKPYEVELEFGGKFAILETLEPGWLGRNRVSSFGYGLEAEGKVNVEAKFNATPVVGKIPYVGPVLLALDKSGLFTILAEIEGTLGMKIAAEQLTEFPPDGVTVSGKPARLGFLGESTRKLEVKMYLRVAGGLGVSALGGRARATALIQVGPPSFTPDVDGVVFTFDPLGQGNLLTKIEGALSVVLRAKLNMLTFNVSKEMQWDIARFVIDRGSEPSFELNPLNISYFVTTPVTSLPQAFIGKETNIIDNFYAAGALDLATGASPLLVFTGIDGAGKMTVMASFRSGSGWSVPVQLGSAAGIISVAVAEQPAGGFLVAWSEVAESDMGNAFPPTTIKFVRSNAAGGGWSAPAVVTTMAAAITDLKLVRAGAKLVLLSLAESDGPQGEKSLRSTAWDGSVWASTQSISAAGNVQSYDATGSVDGDALAVISTVTGNLVSLRWQGSAWVAGGSPGSHAGTALSTALDGFDGLLAWIGTNNRLEISRLNDATGLWGKVATLTTNAVGLECKLTVLTNNNETLYLAAWVSGAEKSSLFYAMVDRTGAVRVPPTEITPGSQGAYSRLELRSLPGLRASLLASFTSGTNTNVREYMLGLPSARDCDGDGIDDALAISTGLVADCNGNGIPDVCDLRAGRSVDRDGDGILDACQPQVADDCDRNGVSDRYQLALGIGDANKNGVLDACESGLRIKRVVFPSAARQTYYRAPGLRLKSLTAGTAEMEYQGVLEKTEDLNKPWTPVP